MAIIPKSFFDAVVAIGIINRTDIKWIGTGFLVGRKETVSDLYTIFIITNHHLVENKHNIIVRFNQKSTNSCKDYRIDLNGINGVNYSKHPVAELVAIQISPHFLENNDSEFSWFALDKHAIDLKTMKETDVIEGSIVYSLGFPINMIGDSRKIPVCRIGCISRIMDLFDDPGPSEYLIDLQAIPGNSGAPVINRPENISIKGTSHNSSANLINVSSQILETFDEEHPALNSEYERIKHYMALGNKVRNDSRDATIIMKGVASLILSERDSVDNPSPRSKVAYIIKSIKHPSEADYLKQVYGDGFHLIGITSDLVDRKKFLTEVKAMTCEQAQELMDRDSDDADDLGQHTQDAFQNSDYFINVVSNTEEIKNCVFRLIDLLFGNPFITPTFDEYAMFMAYAASLRSADLSRQIGAVITKNNEILTTGVNDCPRFNGGLYWQIHEINILMKKTGATI